MNTLESFPPDVEEQYITKIQKIVEQKNISRL